MELIQLFNQKTAYFNLKTKTKKQTIDKLCKLAYQNKIVSNANQFCKDIWKRENQISTGVGEEIAIPHCRSQAVKKPTILFASVNQVDWDSFDKIPVKLVFMLAMPLEDSDKHLKTLATLSQQLINPVVKQKLLKAQNYRQFKNAFLIKKEKSSKNPNQKMKQTNVVAVTACPTGIAHTYLAAEKLKQAASSLNINIKIETQGRGGIENTITKNDIQKANAIIIAADKNIEGLDRFKNQNVIQTSTKEAIANGKKLIQDALLQKTKSFDTNQINSKQTFNIWRHIMAGVSRMLPFIVAGGIILGLGFLLDSGNDGENFGTIRPLAGFFSGLGKLAINMMVPILGGFVAYSIASWQGLLPGILAGLIANGDGLLYGNEQSGWSNLWGRLIPNIQIGDMKLDFNSGFIGGIVGGIIAGLLIILLTKLLKKTPRQLQGVKDIVFVPLISALLIGTIMFAINIPLGFLNLGLKIGIKNMYDFNLHILVGIIVASMMAIDMGGPINKAAYVLGTSLISEGVEGQKIMAAVMIGGMIPPLIIALSTFIFKKQYTQTERDSGISNLFMGLCFITEGAIPFAATRPKQVIPSIIFGSALGGAIVMLLGIALPAPHGGIFVFALLKTTIVSNNIGLEIGLGISFYVGALAIATIAGTLLLALLNKITKKEIIS